MNLGIEDAVTLAELIALRLPTATSDHARLSLCQAWETERLMRARDTIALSDRIQAVGTTTSAMVLAILPLLGRLAFAIPSLRRKIFRLVADIR